MRTKGEQRRRNPSPVPSPKGRRNNATAANLAFGRSFGETTGAERSMKSIAALRRSALVRHVPVTPQGVHHPRHHENGQRLAANARDQEQSGDHVPQADLNQAARRRTLRVR
jgi:hypothetical protein